MQDYFYIKEKLDKVNFSERLAKLSKKFKKKKIVILGLNNSFKLLNSEYNIESYFNIIGITDFQLQIPDDEHFKLIHIDNLYFSGADVIINFKENGAKIENFLRNKRLIKKKMKFINIIDKSFITKISDNIKLIKKIYTTYSITKQKLPILSDLINYNSDDLISRLNYREKYFNLLSNNTEPLRVMFLVFNYRQWTLSNLYFELRSDDSFKILPIVVLPDSLTNKEYNSVDETLNYFKEKGYTCVEGVEKDTDEAVIIKALKPDIIIYQQPEYLKNEYTPEKLSEFALTCYIEPEFNVTNQDDTNNSFINNRLNNTWKIYTTNKYSLKKYKHTQVSGCMLFEKFSQNVSDCTDNNLTDKPNCNHNQIIYSPSLIINNNFDKNCFLEYQKEIFYFISTNLQYHFVTIPNKNFKKQCIDNNIFTEEDYATYITNISAFQNISITNDTDIVNLYKSSSVLITDNISSAIVYFPSGKPIIYIDKGQDKNLNEIGTKIYKTFYIVNSIETMSIVLEDLLSAQNDYNFKKRYAIIGKLSDEFNPKSSIIIKDDLKTVLNRNHIVDDTKNFEQSVELNTTMVLDEFNS